MWRYIYVQYMYGTPVSNRYTIINDNWDECLPAIEIQEVAVRT